ncbi:hypothetical protein JAO76_04360 [Pontibacter sp. BT310]|uniref:Lipoprotein n=1 Tax=Pontibacter populi TaxID=890055 RepID=A0ABS6X8F3_9BACT|nr:MULTISPECIES: hypothetical protein [Pontibacter]MBJ6117408.1 hypothetical protein [Pontibacter sp. BT310]MBR0569833.1 hypothetical protein [Microvirga sp. STS03]MBW3364261.1 hypothetical protein [Pontibacter populi]
MRNWFVFVLLSFLLLSCKEKVAETSVCEYKTDDPQLQVYNDLLIELVEGKFYSLSFGEGSTDTTSFKTIYLSHKSYHKELFEEFKIGLWKAPAPGVNDEIRPLLAKYDLDNAAIFADLSEAQQKYWVSDFQACTFKVDSLGKAENLYELKAEQKVNAIGQVSFSEMRWNKQLDKGVLYYEFYCGGKCGKGELIGFEKVNGRWKIVDNVQLWVS